MKPGKEKRPKCLRSLTRLTLQMPLINNINKIKENTGACPQPSGAVIADNGSGRTQKRGAKFKQTWVPRTLPHLKSKQKRNFRSQNKKHYSNKWKKRKRRWYNEDDFRDSWYHYRKYKKFVFERWPTRTYLQKTYSYGHPKDIRVDRELGKRERHYLGAAFFSQLQGRFLNDKKMREERWAKKKLLKVGGQFNFLGTKKISFSLVKPYSFFRSYKKKFFIHIVPNVFLTHCIEKKLWINKVRTIFIQRFRFLNHNKRYKIKLPRKLKFAIGKILVHKIRTTNTRFFRKRLRKLISKKIKSFAAAKKILNFFLQFEPKIKKKIKFIYSKALTLFIQKNSVDYITKKLLSFTFSWLLKKKNISSQLYDNKVRKTKIKLKYFRRSRKVKFTNFKSPQYNFKTREFSFQRKLRWGYRVRRNQVRNKNTSLFMVKERNLFFLQNKVNYYIYKVIQLQKKYKLPQNRVIYRFFKKKFLKNFKKQQLHGFPWNSRLPFSFSWIMGKQIKRSAFYRIRFKKKNKSKKGYFRHYIGYFCEENNYWKEKKSKKTCEFFKKGDSKFFLKKLRSSFYGKIFTWKSFLLMFRFNTELNFNMLQLRLSYPGVRQNTVANLYKKFRYKSKRLKFLKYSKLTKKKLFHRVILSKKQNKIKFCFFKTKWRIRRWRLKKKLHTNWLKFLKNLEYNFQLKSDIYKMNLRCAPLDYIHIKRKNISKNKAYHYQKKQKFLKLNYIWVKNKYKNASQNQKKTNGLFIDVGQSYLTHQSQNFFFNRVQFKVYMIETLFWLVKMWYAYVIQGHSAVKNYFAKLAQIVPKYWIKNIFKVISFFSKKFNKRFIRDNKNIFINLYHNKNYLFKPELVSYMLEEKFKCVEVLQKYSEIGRLNIWSEINLVNIKVFTKPWMEQVILPKSFKNRLMFFQMWRQLKKPWRRKRNKVYYEWSKFFFKEFDTGMFANRKHQYFRFTLHLFNKILLPFYGHGNRKRFRIISHKHSQKTVSPRETLSDIIENFERRLDVIAYRLNFAPTIQMARNFVRLGFFVVNNMMQINPSFIVQDFAIVQFKDKLSWTTRLRSFFLRKARLYKRGIPKNMLSNLRIGAGLILTSPRQKDINDNERLGVYFLKQARAL